MEPNLETAEKRMCYLSTMPASDLKHNLPFSQQ